MRRLNREAAPASPGQAVYNRIVRLFTGLAATRDPAIGMAERIAPRKLHFDLFLQAFHLVAVQAAEMKMIVRMVFGLAAPA